MYKPTGVYGNGEHWNSMNWAAKVSAPIHPLYFSDPLMSMLNSLCPVRNASKLWPDKIYLGKKRQQNVVGPAIVATALAGPQIIINFLSFSCHAF